MTCAALAKVAARASLPAFDARINDSSTIRDAMRSMLGPVTRQRLPSPGLTTGGGAGVDNCRRQASSALRAASAFSSLYLSSRCLIRRCAS